MATPFTYRGHRFTPSRRRVPVTTTRFNESRKELKPLWACEGPHGWDPTRDGDPSPATRDEAKQILRYRISVMQHTNQGDTQ